MPTTILGLPPSHLPLLLHLLIETPASLSFLLRPESQLPLLSRTTSSTSSKPSTKPSTKITSREATEARLILSNLGGLLLSVNLVVTYLLFFGLNGGKGIPQEVRAREEVVRGVTGWLSVYHLFPLWRAWRRMQMQMGMGLARGRREGAKEGGGEGKGKGKGDDGVDETGKTLGGPTVHFAVHALVGGLMGAVGLGVVG
ncbi:hypothetical protein QBC32DRAFT_384206 [Pseudoneurospora amorphoporcata]|uniref:Uncharacterized protein n=1 Tax=Pseudoneurospora amorphoporcata TaxID=241081 RepID=A0AAN6P4P7_9PEZI|nr:hypothetical protein QBC32DRAFT_384206 [Pseudoneurospora amorphoporcata]